MVTDYYDAVAQQLIQTSNPPHNITVDVAEFPDEPGAMYLIVYAHELSMLAETKVEHVADWLRKILAELNKHPFVRASYSYRVSMEVPR
jgi:hypothetical protein